MTPEGIALAAHIDALCKKHEIGVQYTRKRFAMAEDIVRHIRTPPVKSDTSYAIALHELGHLLGKWQTRSEIIAETGAWLWAENNALRWNDTSRAAMRRGLLSYYEYAQAKGHALPPAGHEFWRLVGN